MGVLVVILTVVGTLVVCGIIVWVIMKNMKKQAYSGVVVRKDTGEMEGASDFTSTYYNLIVKTDDGIEKKVTVGEKIWNQFVVGDKIVKEAGQMNPKKI